MSHSFFSLDAHNGTAAALGAVLSSVGVAVAPHSTMFTLLYPILAAVASKVLYDVVAFCAVYLKAKFVKPAAIPVTVVKIEEKKEE